MTAPHVAQDRAGVARLEARLGLTGATDFFDAVVADAEDYELGLAIGGSDSRENVLLSYNPRTRRTDYRQRALAALEALELDTAPVRDLFDRIDDAHGSTVVGLEWERGGGVSATVYVEELTRFFGRDGAHALAARYAEDYGQPMSVPDSDGEPYILAVDLPGPVVKLYRLHRTAPMGLLASLGIDDPALVAPGAAAYIEQWHLPSGRLKLYRCYDYAAERDDPAEAAALYGEPGPWARILLDELDTLMGRPARVTSVGHRYPAPWTRVLYWCASGPGVR